MSVHGCTDKMHLSLDGEYASVAAEVDAVRKTLELHTACYLSKYVFYIPVFLFKVSLHSHPIEFPLKIKYTMIYESIYPPETNFGLVVKERTSICIS